MAGYFLLIDAGVFHPQIEPALAASWRQHSFEPCRNLCAELVPGVEAFRERYGSGPGRPLVCQAARDLPFRRDLWKHLAGEILFYSAAALPDLPTALPALVCLLAPKRAAPGSGPREEFAPIEQAHLGTRDLVFGGGFYRPDQAGYNDTDDVDRLAAYLASIGPDTWTPADLASLSDLPTDEDRADELAFARECLESLRSLYAEARQHRQVIVCENIEAGRDS